MLLLDNSAWARLASPCLDQSRAEEVAGWMLGGELAVCLPFLLEAGYSARSASEHADIVARLTRLDEVRITEAVESSALRAQEELARAGHHRLPPSDVIIAACAHESGAGVLHYDAHYDVLCARTSLRFDSEWLAPTGRI
jgi:predicted nucleic acid-binding protein